MRGLIKLGVYVAAGVGTYELLRRTGYLTRVSHWLEQQIPQDLKDRAAHLRDQARQRAEDLANQANDTVRRTTGYNDPTAEEADTGRPGGQMLTGNGHGIPVTTDDYAGTHVPHTVGRGVIH